MKFHCRDCGTQVVEYVRRGARSSEVTSWWCGECKKVRSTGDDALPSVFAEDGHPGINCNCQICEENKRRARYLLRKIEAEDREDERLLRAAHIPQDNQFLNDCGVESVLFDPQGRIVV